jgi:hypothetical protein
MSEPLTPLAIGAIVVSVFCVSLFLLAIWIWYSRRNYCSSFVPYDYHGPEMVVPSDYPAEPETVVSETYPSEPETVVPSDYPSEPKTVVPLLNIPEEEQAVLNHEKWKARAANFAYTDALEQQATKNRDERLSRYRVSRKSRFHIPKE